MQPLELYTYLYKAQMIHIILPGDPIAKMRPRITRKGAYDPQHSIKHAAKFQVLSQVNRLPVPYASCVPIEIEIDFYFSVPKGKENLHQWDLLYHISKPDYDNCEKWILDVMSGIVYEDDRQVFRCTTKKHYDENPRTEIYIVPKKSNASDQVKEVLSIISPDYFCELSTELAYIADSRPGQASIEPNFERIVFLICEFAEKHADNLKKINKKFPGLAKVLNERLREK